MAETDWMCQWVVTDPRQEKTYEQAEQLLGHPKVLGIKIHPTYHGYDILDYADPLLAIEKQQAFLMVAGRDLNPWQRN